MTLLAALKVEMRMVSATIISALRPRTTPTACGGDGVAGGCASGAESDEIGDYGDDIEPCEDQRAEQEGAGEGFLRVDDFAGAVGAELPAFVGPEDGDHG